MNADAYFEIGASHTVCEDYALAGTVDDLSYAIVSDGCSSSKDTDLGARLLAHIAKDVLLYLKQRKVLYNGAFIHGQFVNLFEELVIKKAQEVRTALQLKVDVFDATLLVAASIGPYQRIAYVRGDGYVIAKKKNGVSQVFTLNYESNAPYYLSYEMSFDKKTAYEQQYGDVPIYYEEYVIGSEGSITLMEKEDCPAKYGGFYQTFDNGSKPAESLANLKIQDILRFTDTIQLAVSSDGLNTYEYDPKITWPEGERPKNPGVMDIIPHVTGFKNMVGQFAVRRMNRFRRDCEKDHIIHQDDVSVAAIYGYEE